MTKAIGCFYVRIFFKEYCRTLFLSVCPFFGRFKKQIARAYQQFLACVAIWIPEWYIILSTQLCFLHLIVCLLDGIPTMLDAQFLNGVTSQFLNMESVNNTAGFGEGNPHNLTHGLRQVKRDFLHGIALMLINTLKHSYHVLRLCACNDCY